MTAGQGWGAHRRLRPAGDRCRSRWRSRRARRCALATAVVIAAAAWMWHDLPTPDEVYAPFDVPHAGMGQQAIGRPIAAQVARSASARGSWTRRYAPLLLDAVGTWVAVDGEAMSTLADAVPTVELIVGPEHLRAHAPTRVHAAWSAPWPRYRVRSAWVFDVPADLVARGRRRT